MSGKLLRRARRGEAAFARGLTCSAQVRTFAVNGPARGKDDIFDRVATIGEDVEEESGPLDIHPVVSVDLIHRLAGTGLGREVDDRVDIPDRSLPTVANRDIAPDKFNAFGPMKNGVRSVDLRREVIENSHCVAGTERPAGQMGADESGASSDENLVHISADGLTNRGRERLRRTPPQPSAAQPRGARPLLPSRASPVERAAGRSRSHGP